MAAYYNEIDPYAAAWLRNLIKAGHIAPGDVDERSIEDVLPSELAGYTQCHFFAGIGVWSLALRRAGWSDDREIWTGSCPCQPFSAAGKGGGVADERHLWPAWHHLIDQCRPANIFGEQVASKDGLGWLDLVLTDLEASGYACGAADICAAGLGAPHIRQRLWIVANRMADTLGRRVCARGRGQDVGAPRGVQIEGGERQRVRPDAGECCCVCGLANTHDERLHGRGTSLSCNGGIEALEPERPYDASRLADTQQHDCGCEAEPADCGTPQANRPADRAGGCGSSLCRLADPSGERCVGGQGVQGRCEHDGTDAGRQQSDDGIVSGGEVGDVPQRPGPVNGFWADADWLFCRDGKWRAVEPGSFPLVNGATARVGRIRAYGNAINAAVAETVIRSYLDTEANPACDLF